MDANYFHFLHKELLCFNTRNNMKLFALRYVYNNQSDKTNADDARIKSDLTLGFRKHSNLSFWLTILEKYHGANSYHICLSVAPYL